MTDNGYVYVLMNPSMDNLVKIGKTTREPEKRAKELSSTTGVPTPFVVVYDCYFENCSEAEVFVHTYLENQGFRVSSNREFFEIPIKDAIDSVMKAKEHFGEFETINKDSSSEYDLCDYEEETREPWEEVYEMAVEYYLGNVDGIEDYEEAMKYYLQAIKLGSIEAYSDVGAMYYNGDGVSKNINKALQYFKEGAKKGNVYCYYWMARSFSEQGDSKNALASWKNYFELSNENEFHFSGGMRDSQIIGYVEFIRKNALELHCIDKIQVNTDDVIQWILDTKNMNDSRFPYNEYIFAYCQEQKELT